MRFSSNKQLYGSHLRSTNPLIHQKRKINRRTETIKKSSTTSFYRNNNHTNSSIRYQRSYVKRDGTIVRPHVKTNINSTNHDNFSSNGNINPYTNIMGVRAKDYSVEATNYGRGKEIVTGSRGGQYYYNSQGNKIYVPKR